MFNDWSVPLKFVMNIVKILDEYIDVKASVHLREPSGYGPNVALPLKAEGAVLSIEAIHPSIF